jgi:SpoVK/Ycf46/Vps4 family AAA+-type ATPase
MLNFYYILSQIFQEARRNLPSIIYVPAIAQWWNLVPETLHAVFLSHLCKLDPSAPILLIATADVPYNTLPHEVSCNVFVIFDLVLRFFISKY